MGLKIGGLEPIKTTERVTAIQPTERVAGKEIAGPELDASSPVIRAILGLTGPDTASRGGAYPARPPLLDTSSPIVRASLGLAGPDTAAQGGDYPMPPEADAGGGGNLFWDMFRALSDPQQVRVRLAQIIGER